MVAGVMDATCFHNQRDLRLPLGIYNVSVSRICDKVNRLSQKLEDYFSLASSLNTPAANGDLMKEVIDCVELSLYAAAEHIDDIDSIASGFFKQSTLRDKNSSYKSLQKDLKRDKKFIAAAANAIKHQQSRIRLFSMEYFLNGANGCLHGYFIEAVDGGVVGPSKKFHQTQEVFSLTTLVWEILVFLLNCSRSLARFLQDVSSQIVGPVSIRCDVFSMAAAAATRLPLYTFGEEHPFSRVELNILPSNCVNNLLQSKLIGSLDKGWLLVGGVSFGQHVSRFEGDGKTRSFKFAQAKGVILHHWS